MDNITKQTRKKEGNESGDEKDGSAKERSGSGSEYAFAWALCKCLNDCGGDVEFTDNSRSRNAKSKFEHLSLKDREDRIAAGKETALHLITCEPNLTDASQKLVLTIRPEAVSRSKDGIPGDVRDVLCIKSSIGWTVGFSIKHNNIFIRSFRLRKDFFQVHFGAISSSIFVKAFDDLRNQIFQHSGENWKEAFSEIEKENTIYIPAMTIFL